MLCIWAVTCALCWLVAPQCSTRQTPGSWQGTEGVAFLAALLPGIKYIIHLRTDDIKLLQAQNCWVCRTSCSFPLLHASHSVCCMFWPQVTEIRHDPDHEQARYRHGASITTMVPCTLYYYKEVLISIEKLKKVCSCMLAGWLDDWLTG